MELLGTGRRVRLPGGSSIILGRDRTDNALLKGEKGDAILAPINCPGPTALIPSLKCETDLELALELVCSYSKYDRLQSDIVIQIFPEGIKRSIPRPYVREKFKEFQIC